LAGLITGESQHYELFLTDMLITVADIGDDHEDPEKKQVGSVVSHRSILSDNQLINVKQAGCA
jgi:hypothetical protein